MKRGLALAVGLLAAALALFALLARRDGSRPDEEIDERSREALEEVLKQEEE